MSTGSTDWGVDIFGGVILPSHHVQISCGSSLCLHGAWIRARSSGCLKEDPTHPDDVELTSIPASSSPSPSYSSCLASFPWECFRIKSLVSHLWHRGSCPQTAGLSVGGKEYLARSQNWCPFALV